MHTRELTASHVGALMAHIASGAIPVRVHPEAGAPPQAVPFVTISREAGAGGTSLGDRLAVLLNERDRCEPVWQSFDRELIEKVAADHNISTKLIDLIESRPHTWLDELLEHGPASEFGIHQRVAKTIRALAQVGRTIIVGRGGMFITHGMPGGVHVRLIAPLIRRIENYARDYSLPTPEAARRVNELDRHRLDFYRRHWDVRALTADMFTVTFNTAQIDVDAMAKALATLIPRQARKTL
jgi:cytidylate kinase